MYNILPTDEIIQKTKMALEQNGMAVTIAENGAEAKNKVLELIPKGAEVMTMTSKTSDAIGLTQELDISGNYDSVRVKLTAMDRNTQGREMRKLGTAPDYAVGSVHALTQDGTAITASATGSQFPAYAYAAAHVIWVVGSQKIVTDEQEAIKRIYEYSLPLESERAREAYGVAGSSVNKLLTVKKRSCAGQNYSNSNKGSSGILKLHCRNNGNVQVSLFSRP